MDEIALFHHINSYSVLCVKLLRIQALLVLGKIIDCRGHALQKRKKAWGQAHAD